MTHQTQSKQPTKDGAESSSPKQAQSVNTRAQKIARLKNKEYRDAFVASQISVGLPFQIRALREQRDWKQSRLAAEADMLQPRISAMERPGESKFNLETLRRLASAFDVALEVRFVPFSDLVDWSDRFNPDDFRIVSFKDDFAEKKPPSKVTEAAQKVLNVIASGGSAAGGQRSAELSGSANPGERKEPEKLWLGYTGNVVSITPRPRVTARKRKAERRQHA